MPGVLADAVLLTHAAFVAWVVFGVLAVWRWPRLAALHLPARRSGRRRGRWLRSTSLCTGC
ncbi:MAG: DUF2784 family protein [Candidatus Nanopelagicales bacterium]